MGDVPAPGPLALLRTLVLRLGGRGRVGAGIAPARLAGTDPLRRGDALLLAPALPPGTDGNIGRVPQHPLGLPDLRPFHAQLRPVASAPGRLGGAGAARRISRAICRAAGRITLTGRRRVGTLA